MYTLCYMYALCSTGVLRAGIIKVARVTLMTPCGRGERAKVRLNLGDSGVFCKGSVTGLPCPLGCPATMWAGHGANKRLFSGDTAGYVWRREGGEKETVLLGCQWEKWTVCAQTPVV